MANHVSTMCEVSGPAKEIKRFKKNMFLKSEFNFNGILPMPEEIKNSESSSLVESGLAILGYFVNDALKTVEFLGKEECLGRMLKYSLRPTVSSIEDLENHLLERNPQIIELAQKHLGLYEKYGSLDWYNWAMKYWSTKINAFDTKIQSQESNELNFSFSTAWDHPVAVFNALEKEYPLLKITTKYMSPVLY